MKNVEQIARRLNYRWGHGRCTIRRLNLAKFVSGTSDTADICRNPQASRICDLTASETTKSLVWLLQNLDEMGLPEVNAIKAADEIKQQAVVPEGPSQDPSSATTTFASSPQPTTSNSNLDHKHRQFTEIFFEAGHATANRAWNVSWLLECVGQRASVRRALFLTRTKNPKSPGVCFKHCCP